MPEIQIRQGRGKLLGMALACGIMIAIGVAMLFGNGVALKGFGVFFIVLFGALLCFLLYRMGKPTLLLTVNEAGFTDHSKSRQLGFVSWGRVHNISLIRYNGEMYIEVLMDDPEGLVEKLSRGLPTKARKQGDPEGVARLHIPAVFIDRKPQVAYDEMVLYVQAYRKERAH